MVYRVFSEGIQAGEYYKTIDVIVLDFNDAVQGGLEILRESDCIYMIEKQDTQSVKKRECFENIVNNAKKLFSL